MQKGTGQERSKVGQFPTYLYIFYNIDLYVCVYVGFFGGLFVVVCLRVLFFQFIFVPLVFFFFSSVCSFAVDVLKLFNSKNCSFIHHYFSPTLTHFLWLDTKVKWFIGMSKLLSSKQFVKRQSKKRRGRKNNIIKAFPMIKGSKMRLSNQI